MAKIERDELITLLVLAHAEARGDDEDIIELLRDAREKIVLRHNITAKDEVALLGRLRRDREG